MKEIEYHELQVGPINPNRARWYSLGLTALGVLFAFLTIKTNWDYFDQYYDGFGFWARVIPFFAVEVAIVILPLFKGFGNKSQGNVALVCELLIVAAALTHTYLVSDASIAKLQAGKTKTEASADFDRAQAVADRVSSSNQKLQENYAVQMRFWNDAVRVARREGRAAPREPQAPILQDVTQVSQDLVNNATMSVETVGEARVSHQTLQRLLFLLIGMVMLSVTAMVLLADGSRVKAWLLGQRAEEIKSKTKGQTKTLGSIFEKSTTKQAPGMAPPMQSQASGRNQPPGK